eukprot:g7203.t1
MITAAPLSTDLPLQVAVAISVLLLARLLSTWLTVDDGSMDGETKSLLEGKAEVPAECQAMVTALESAAMEDDEGACAAQMVSILRAGHLSYTTLIDRPELLLRCSQGMEGANGALWTRFTVQYNLYAGSIVALGTDAQRTALVASQASGELGCFAFTERGAGVLSGAAVETTAHWDGAAGEFVIDSPTESSAKTWISQGMYAETAVILAKLSVGGEDRGPHLFWARIADIDAGARQDGAPQRVTPRLRPRPRRGVSLSDNPRKTALLGLDNAEVRFTGFRVPHGALLARFGGVDARTGAYVPALPAGCGRMLDVLLARLLTGRIVLSEATLAHAVARLRLNWRYAAGRALWQGRRATAVPMMAGMPNVQRNFRDYGRSAAVLQAFVAATREDVADAIRSDRFTPDTVEATCMCKFLGTGTGVDVCSAVRKVMGARALQADARLGAQSFLPNATSAAEGDNTIMELKVVQDVVRGRTARLPWALMWRVAAASRAGRRAAGFYLLRLARATLLRRRAVADGELLRDIAWARAHMRVIDVWLAATAGSPARRAWLHSYEKVLMRFPTPTQA